MKREARLVERREKWIAAMLWYGTLAASALVAIGLLLGAIGSLNPVSPANPAGLAFQHAGVAETAGSHGSEGWVKAGVAFFILLPVARVALMLAIFLYERDTLYLLITLFVLAMLATGFLIGCR